MSDYPDPDEEYELMYADELELLRENDENNDPSTGPEPKKINQAKRSLDFSSPISKKPCKIIEKEPECIDIVDPLPLTASQPTENVVPSNNKRTVEDLFGDIDDIDLEMPSKKPKTEEEIDREMIDRILEGRKMRRMVAEPSRITTIDKTVYDTKSNLSVDIPRWNFLPLTNSEGERIYVRLETETAWDTALDQIGDTGSFKNTYAAVWEEARKILEKKQENATQLATQTQLVNMETEDMGTKLWVDKYRPDSYIDLLSEEPVNRSLLHWLHLWDKVVFKKETITSVPQQRSSFNKRAGQFQLSNNWRGKAEVESELDKDGRPRFKVALLCGPPGVGKTTLAHLLARLAGYRPVELNASDERSVESFQNALQSATLMRSVLDAEKRPNCLILDEIDGAPLPTIELLVKWCNATTNEAGSKKKSKIQPLRRPVIGICNDLYATALRPLRSVSQIIPVSGVSERRLLSRLIRVSQCEHLQLPTSVLSGLARRAGGDVRAALHVLSFVKGRQGKISLDDIVKAKIGEKDCTKNAMQALQAVFTFTDAADPIADCLKVINACGEYDRIIEGIFENYPEARANSNLKIPSETMKWLVQYDIFNTWIQRHQNYSVYPMLSYCAAVCRTVLGTRNPTKIRFPQKAQEMNRKKQEVDSILSSIYREAIPTVRVSSRVLRLDIVPLLPYILTPKLRSNNVQLCTENEKINLYSAASTMCDFGVQYIQQRTVEGLYAFVMEPDVYQAAFFGSAEHMRPPPPIRQAIAREQQLENIRRNEIMTGKVSGKEPIEKPKQPSIVKMKPQEQEVKLPNHLQRLTPKAVTKVTPQVQKDFFGRVVPIIESSQRSESVRDLISSSSIFYQYREGFNNAVRRSVRVRDLL